MAKYVIGIVFCACFLLSVFCIANFAYKEFIFSQVDPVPVKCRLLSISHSPSTIQTRTAPIFSSEGGTSLAIYTTGNPEKTTTLWQCGKYGRLATNNKNIFRFAKEESTLLIRSNQYDTRIVDIICDNENR